MRLKIFSGLFLLFIISKLFAQEGYIRGTIFDASTGELLPGVTIYIEGTTKGTITDLDGKFNLNILTGTYDLRISFISYETIILKDINVQSGQVTNLENMGMKEAIIELNEVVVMGEMARNSENALLILKNRSVNLMDGISAVNFRKIGDSDAASSMKRVTGVSVEGGKYVYVRGLGDRYTKTILNGLDIPGLDPDRNTLQMDIFPTNVIDNIIVHKSSSADLPADFTGGVIDIETKDFPEEKQGNISMGVGYNPEFHFNNDYLTYKGGKTDFLGFDDGTRVIPATNNIPEFANVVGNPDGENGLRYKEILESFNPAMATLNERSLLDYSFSASFGNQSELKKTTIGYNFTLSYKNNTEYYKDAEYGRYGLSTNPDIMEMEIREHQIGNFGVNSAFLSGLAGFAIKTRFSKYRINLLHLQNGESKAGIFDFTGSDQGSDFQSKQHNLDYSQRSLTNLLLDGRHTFYNSKWEFKWKLSPTISRLNDPDVRFTRYEVNDDGSFRIGTEVGYPERIWRDMEEINIAGLVHFTKEFNTDKDKIKVKFGGSYTYKERDYAIRKFLLNIRGDVPLHGNPDELLADELIWPYNGNLSAGTTFESNFDESNIFNANANYIAGYISTELNFFNRLKSVFGVRIENYTQKYTGQNQQGNKILDNDIVLDDLDIFPSVNFVYSLTTVQNIRISYSKTIARPSFKELSFAEIYDPISGQTFIGGMHEDGQYLNDIDLNNDIIYWNGNLKSTEIYNFDLRWELFKPNSQMLSVSGFYKRFNNPIEIVQYAVQTGSYQPRNVGNGEVYGAETEFRLNLDFLGEALKSIQLSLNFTFTKSRIKLNRIEYDSRVANVRTGQSIDKYRNMAGQSPIIINSGISYNEGQKGFWKGFEAGIYYNVQGQTLEYVGIVDRPDIYSKPFHSLNFNSNKKFGKNSRIQIGFKAENILNAEKESIFKSYNAADKYFTKLEPGMNFKLSLNYLLL